MIYPSREDFLKKSEQGNLIPVYREMIADMETPVAAYRKLADARYAFLLESVEGGEKIGRFSFVGAQPQVVFRSKNGNVEIEFANGRRESYHDPRPLRRLRELMKRYQFVNDASLPPFCGGAVGYVGYDEVRNLEPVGDHVNDDLHVPDIFFMISDSLLIFDHVHHRVKLLVNAYVGDGVPAREAYDQALSRINALHQKLLRLPPRSERTVTLSEVALRGNMEAGEYEARVERCKEYILAGDAFQIVLSQRFQTPITCEPFEIYRALRVVNPSPYMYFLKFDELHIAGTSPEILVRVSGDHVQVRPIAGTRPRDPDRDEDDRLEAELRADPKECAEHIMLVDLGRNDIGRVCEYGSVHVDDLMVVERYSHVMHLVSNVVGKLRPNLDAFDVFEATFPAGTVSGAPKIRAMQIINELEPVSRGPYAGAVGYFSFNGNFDSCITIRTILMKDEKAYLQAGAGIVADSVPENENRECRNKAGAMVRAIEMAEGGLD
jgi:anthranilate synthase component I